MNTPQRDHNLHPRKWWRGFTSYNRYLGYIKPFLDVESQEEYVVRRQLLSKSWEPRLLNAPIAKKLLTISPHPDDESIGAGGLLWAHRTISEIHCLVVSAGEKGGRTDAGKGAGEDARMIAIRKKEFAQAASTLNARSLHFLDFPDGNIPCTMQAAERMHAVIAAIQPDVILIPWFLDNHIDHRRSNLLYAWGCAGLNTVVLAYEVWTMLEPNAFFDISAHIASKVALIRNYESQLATIDYTNYIEGLASVRAFQAPMNMAHSKSFEAFIALPNNEYCDLVKKIYGTQDCIRKSAYRLLGLPLGE